MSVFMDNIIKRAQAHKQTIVLPEGEDERTLQAAQQLLKKKIANIIILTNEDTLKDSLYELENACVINPKNSDLKEELATQLYELRKAKGLTPEDALNLIENKLYFGVMLVKSGRAQGMVAGACHATAEVLRPSLQILKTAPGVKLVSSFFIMVVPDTNFGDHGVFLFSDCGLVVQPDADALAQIALNSALSWKALQGSEPQVALLSHSTAGSASNDDVAKVIEATKRVQAMAPELMIDGELQADAAIVASVGAAKAPQSCTAGRANVLIFPDLDAGNIAYKLVQRLAHADAFGPITQGIAAPINDLSRGCSADDIVGVVAITCVQAQQCHEQSYILH